MLLVDHWLEQANFVVRALQYQITACVYSERIAFFKLETDRVGIGAGSNHKVVFQLSLLAVILDVDSRIHSRVSDSAIRRYVGSPASGIAADEVVDLSRQFLQTYDVGVSVSCRNFHSQHT